MKHKVTLARRKLLREGCFYALPFFYGVFMKKFIQSLDYYLYEYVIVGSFKFIMNEAVLISLIVFILGFMYWGYNR